MKTFSLVSRSAGAQASLILLANCYLRDFRRLCRFAMRKGLPFRGYFPRSRLCLRPAVRGIASQENRGYRLPENHRFSAQQSGVAARKEFANSIILACMSLECERFKFNRTFLNTCRQGCLRSRAARSCSVNGINDAVLLKNSSFSRIAPLESLLNL